MTARRAEMTVAVAPAEHARPEQLVQTEHVSNALPIATEKFVGTTDAAVLAEIAPRDFLAPAALCAPASRTARVKVAGMTDAEAPAVNAPGMPFATEMVLVKFHRAFRTAKD